jgi:hypothetical protein
MEKIVKGNGIKRYKKGQEAMRKGKTSERPSLFASKVLGLDYRNSSVKAGAGSLPHRRRQQRQKEKWLIKAGADTK